MLPRLFMVTLFVTVKNQKSSKWPLVEIDQKQIYIQTMKLYIHIMEGYVIVKRKKNEEVFHILIQKNSPIYRNMLCT